MFDHTNVQVLPVDTAPRARRILCIVSVVCHSNVWWYQYNTIRPVDETAFESRLGAGLKGYFCPEGSASASACEPGTYANEKGLMDATGCIGLTWPVNLHPRPAL